jgi:hypothetical protein
MRLLTMSVGFVAAAAALYAQSPQVPNSITPRELVVDPPTLINLGFEWLIDGDANRNASVEVSYRRQGASEWKRGMPAAQAPGRTDRSAELVEPCRPEHVRGQHSRPRAGHRLRGALRAHGSRWRERAAVGCDENRHGSNAC